MVPNQLYMDIALFMVGFVLLTGGAEFLVRGASRLASRMNVSSVVIGLTVVAFGTSLPELLVSVIANLESEHGSAIPIGNIVGSNIANLGLILGAAGLFAAIHVERHLMRREIPIMLTVSVAFTAMAWNGDINRWEGVILLLVLTWFTYFSYNAVRTFPEPAVIEDAEQALEVLESIEPDIVQPSTNPLRDFAFVLVGLTGLIFGAEWLVTSAESIARTIGVSDLVIGLTLVALGTSLPELATTIVAVRRNEGDIAVGNVVGSNLFNILFIGGVASVIQPLSIPAGMRSLHLPFMVGISLLVYALAWHRPHRLVRWQGALMVLLYFGYSVWLFAGAN